MEGLSCVVLDRVFYPLLSGRDSLAAMQKLYEMNIGPRIAWAFLLEGKPCFSGLYYGRSLFSAPRPLLSNGSAQKSLINGVNSRNNRHHITWAGFLCSKRDEEDLVSA
jgi:hypothetical protein